MKQRFQTSSSSLFAKQNLTLAEQRLKRGGFELTQSAQKSVLNLKNVYSQLLKTAGFMIDFDHD